MSKRIAKSKIIMLQKERRAKCESEKTVCWISFFKIKPAPVAHINFAGLQEIKNSAPIFTDLLKKAVGYGK